MMTTRKVQESKITHENTDTESRFVCEIQINVRLDKNTQGGKIHFVSRCLANGRGKSIKVA